MRPKMRPKINVLEYGRNEERFSGTDSGANFGHRFVHRFVYRFVHRFGR